MSVIIEGLTLPKHNPKEIDKNVLIGYAIVKEDNTAELCLEGVHYLIKMLPTPHGRLIDADILLDAIRYGAEVRDFCNKKCKSQDCQNCVIKAVYKIIREVPTIIEAEVSENA